MTTPAAQPYNSSEAHQYIEDEMARVIAQYRATDPSLTDAQFENAAENAEYCLQNYESDKSAARFLELFEASIY